MNRLDFMKQLEYLLQDIPDEEKADALAYYQDYLEEAGDDNEAQVIMEFGSPERIAAIIRSELCGDLEDGGSFTETGYQDERFREPGYQVAEHRNLPDISETAGFDEKKGKRPGGGWQDDSFWMRLLKVGGLLLAFAIIGPMVLGAGGAVVSVAAGLLITLAAIILLVGFGTIVLCLMAVVVIVFGISMLIVNPWSGVFLLGVGVFLLGCSFIGIALSILVYGRMVPFGIRSTTDGISRIFHRNKRRTQ
ncbi:MAG: DUF1700 domain-containing protein [Lachnospiraceae bacterium]